MDGTVRRVKTTQYRFLCPFIPICHRISNHELNDGTSLYGRTRLKLSRVRCLSGIACTHQTDQASGVDGADPLFLLEEKTCLILPARQGE